MKLIRTIIKEGLNDKWTHGNKTVTLKELLDLIKHIPVSDIPTEKLKSIVLDWGGDKKEDEKIEKSNLKYPVLIITDDNNNMLYILDGNHRVQKAIKYNIPYVKAVLIKLSELPEDFQYVLK